MQKPFWKMELNRYFSSRPGFFLNERTCVATCLQNVEKPFECDSLREQSDRHLMSDFALVAEDEGVPTGRNGVRITKRVIHSDDRISTDGRQCLRRLRCFHVN